MAKAKWKRKKNAHTGRLVRTRASVYQNGGKLFFNRFFWGGCGCVIKGHLVDNLEGKNRHTSKTNPNRRAFRSGRVSVFSIMFSWFVNKVIRELFPLDGILKHFSFIVGFSFTLFYTQNCYKFNKSHNRYIF